MREKPTQHMTNMAYTFYTLCTCYLCKHYFPPIMYSIKHWRILYSDKKLVFVEEYGMTKFRHLSLEVVVESPNPIWSVYNFISGVVNVNVNKL
jgi:hypothetical protein